MWLKEWIKFNAYVEVSIRAIGAFIFLLILTRLMGREQIAQLTFFDYIVGITIGSIAATLTTTPQDPFLPGLLGLVIWGLLPILIGWLTLKWVPARKIIEGEPVVVIQDGKIDEETVARQRLNYDDLLMLLREQKVFNIHDVENAVYERNGQLSVQMKSQQEPVTPKDLGLNTNYKGLPTTIIEDGTIITNRLKEAGLSKDWLIKTLQREYGVETVNDVSIAQLDTQGNLYVDIINEPRFIN